MSLRPRNTFSPRAKIEDDFDSRVPGSGVIRIDIMNALNSAYRGVELEDESGFAIGGVAGGANLTDRRL